MDRLSLASKQDWEREGEGMVAPRDKEPPCKRRALGDPHHITRYTEF